MGRKGSLPRPLFYDVFNSPIGRILAAVSDRGLFLVEYPLRLPPGKALERYAAPPWSFRPVRSEPRTRRARRQLEAYFRGGLRRFDLPLDLRGTPFELKVWRELRRIPFGETVSYGELAVRIGRSGAARAVGTANNRNRLGIIVPCHRVIGADGGLAGYSAGPGVKKALLAHERRVPMTQPPQLKIRPPAGGTNPRRPPPGGGRRFRRRGT